MTRVFFAIASWAAMLAVCALGSPSVALASSGGSARAYVVIATGLQWGDVTATSTPHMHALAARGAVGNLNARPRSRESWEPATALEGALGISAGGWAVPDFQAMGAFDASETVRGVAARLLYQRLNGSATQGHSVVYLGLPPVSRANAATGDKPVLGTLGQAVVDAGGTTTAIGNSDSGDSVTEQKYSRPAGVVAMDTAGRVTYGDVSASVLASAPQWPYGVRTDVAAVDRVLSACEASASAHGGPALIVLDPGDEYRARRYAWQVSDAVKQTQHLRAVRGVDEIVGLAVAHAGPRDTVIVCTQAPSETVPGLTGFSPLLVSGSGLRGYLTSGSTHREGTVSNPDITAFVLDVLGVAQPAGTIGNTLSASSGPASAAERLAYLSARNETAVSLDGIRGPFTSLFVQLFTGMVIVAGFFVAVRGRFSKRVQRAVVTCIHGLGLTSVIVLASGLGMFAFVPPLRSPVEAGVWLALTTALMCGIAVLVWRRFGGTVVLTGTLLVTFALFLGDQLAGAPLSVTSLIGYSPLIAVRYYGIGNEAAALMVGAGLMGIGLLLDIGQDAPWSVALRRFGIPVAWLLVVAAAAAPSLGANVGVAVWATGGFGILWLLANGRRVTWRWVLAGVLLAALAIGAFAAIDLLGGAEKTHLARSLTAAEESGTSKLWSIVARKAQMNARILGQTTWTSVLGAVIAFIAFAGLRRRSELARVFDANPAFRAAVFACGVAGALAFLSEDTGVLVPSFISVCAGVAVVWHVLSGTEPEGEGR